MVAGGQELSPPEEKPLSLFLSYSREDWEFAQNVVTVLEEHLVRVHYDQRDLPIGEEWRASLADMIRDCDAVLVVLSPGSASSEAVLWELEEARSCSKRIAPILWNAPDLSAFPSWLASVHGIRVDALRLTEEETIKLLDHVKRDWEWEHEHTNLSRGAGDWTSYEQHSDYLLRGERLKAALRWHQETPHQRALPPSPDVVAWLLESRRAAGRRRLRLPLIALLIVTLVTPAVVWGILPWRREHLAEERAKLALELLDRDIAGAAASALRGYELAATPQTEDALRRVLGHRRISRSEACSSGLRFRFGPDEDTVVGLGTEHTLVWSNSGVPRERPGSTLDFGGIRGSALAPDRRHLALRSPGGATVVELGADRGSIDVEQSIPLDAPTGLEVSALALSPDAKRLAVLLSGPDFRRIPPVLEVWSLPDSRRLSSLRLRRDLDEQLRLVNRPVDSMVFAGGGRFLLTFSPTEQGSGMGSRPPTVELRDTEDLRLLGHFPSGWFAGLYGSAVTVARDGGTALCLGPNGEGRLVQVEGPEQPARTFAQDLVGTAWSPDGTMLAGVTGDSEVVLWSADSLEELRRLHAPTTGLTHVRFARSGSRVFAHQSSHPVRMFGWDLSDPQHFPLWSYPVPREDHGDPSADGTSVLVPFDSKIEGGRHCGFWQVRVEAPRPLTLGEPRPSRGTRLAWSADGARLVVLRERSSECWSVETGALLNSWSLEPRDTEQLVLGDGPRGSTLALDVKRSVDREGRVDLFVLDAETGELGPGLAVRRPERIEFDGSLAIVDYEGGLVLLKISRSGAEVVRTWRRIPVRPDGQAPASAGDSERGTLAPKGDVHLQGGTPWVRVSTSALGEARIENARTGVTWVSLGDQWTLLEHVTNSAALVLSEVLGGQFSLVEFNERGDRVRTLDMGPIAERRSWHEVDEKMACVARLPESHLRFCIEVWNARSGDLLETIDCGISTEIELGPRGDLLASWDAEAVDVYEIAGESRPAQLHHDSRVVDVEFSPDGESLAVALEDGRVVVHSRASFAPIVEVVSHLHSLLEGGIR